MNFSCGDFCWVLLNSGDSLWKESSVTNFRYGWKPEKKRYCWTHCKDLGSLDAARNQPFVVDVCPHWINFRVFHAIEYWWRSKLLYCTCEFKSIGCFWSFHIRKRLIPLLHIHFQPDILYLTWEHNVPFGKRFLHCTLQGHNCSHFHHGWL